MGVELGKVLAKNILSQLSQTSDVIGHDSSVRVSFRYASELSLRQKRCVQTTGLIHYYQKHRKE
jgi:glucose-6-phosphate isomerase